MGDAAHNPQPPIEAQFDRLLVSLRRSLYWKRCLMVLFLIAMLAIFFMRGGDSSHFFTHSMFMYLVIVAIDAASVERLKTTVELVRTATRR